MALIIYVTLLAALSTLAFSSPQARRLQARNQTAPVVPAAPAASSSTNPDSSYAGPPSSTCHMIKADESDPYRNAYGTPAMVVRVTIANKSTIEKGPPGKGLMDNLKGECGDLINDSKYPEGEIAGGTYRSGQEAWYTVQAALAMAAAMCVMRAIQKAENQAVTCEIGTGNGEACDWGGFCPSP